MQSRTVTPSNPGSFSDIKTIRRCGDEAPMNWEPYWPNIRQGALIVPQGWFGVLSNEIGKEHRFSKIQTYGVVSCAVLVLMSPDGPTFIFSHIDEDSAGDLRDINPLIEKLHPQKALLAHTNLRNGSILSTARRFLKAQKIPTSTRKIWGTPATIGIELDGTSYSLQCPNHGRNTCYEHRNFALMERAVTEFLGHFKNTHIQLPNGLSSDPEERARMLDGF